MRTSVLSLVALAACGSVTTYQSADTNPRGAWSGFAALSAGSYDDKPQQAKTPSIVGEIGARRGIGDDTDVGVKLYTVGIEFSIRQRLVDNGVGGWSWALLGAIGGMHVGESNPAIPESNFAQGRIGVVTTRRTSAKWGWNLGIVTTASVFSPAGGGTAYGALLGLFAGFDWRFGAKWHLLPELSLHGTIAGDVPVDGSIGQLGVAFGRDF